MQYEQIIYASNQFNDYITITRGGRRCPLHGGEVKRCVYHNE